MIVRGHIFVALAALAVVVFLWTPLVVVVINSFNQNELLTGWEGATGDWYAKAFENPAIRAGVRASVVIAAFSSALSVLLAVSGALWWKGASKRGRALFDGITYLRLLLPEAVFALALLTLFSRISLPLGIVAVVIGHTVWNSAFATLIVQARLSALDPALADAAADLGANPWRAFRRVTVPALLPGIVAAALLAFTFSFDDVVTSQFLSGSSVAPLPVVVLSMIRVRISPEINAIGMMVMTFTVAMVGAATLVSTRFRARSQPKSTAQVQADE